MKKTKKILSFLLTIIMIVTTVPFAFAAECDHELNLDGDIKTPVICSSCNNELYVSDSRWTIGTYESVYENVCIAKFKGFFDFRDEIVAYYVVKTAAGCEYNMSFDWAINQGYTDYGEFTLKMYHNDKEIITRDFTKVPNPYRNILSEEYNYTAEGEIQVFKFVFSKLYSGWWADDGRMAYLNNIEHLCVTHIGEATCTEPAICEICNEKFADALGHADEDGDYVCDNGCGYEFPCEDCGRVHKSVITDIFCKITQFFLILFRTLGYWE